MANILWVKAILMMFLVSYLETNAQQIEFSNLIKIEYDDTKEEIIAKAAHVIPTPNQYQAVKNEFIASIHYGPNSFTGREWGDGKEDPTVFNPSGLDTDQWCDAMKSAGIKMVIITAKHHDGYILWQSRYTKHGIMSSPYKNGKADVVKNLSKSCKKYGLKLGIYISPADLFQMYSENGLYANNSEFTMRTIPRKVKGRRFKNQTKFKFLVDDYNEYMLNQMFELLTEYGPVHELWFDGAHPSGRKGQKYNLMAWRKLIKTLAPESVIFNLEDIRWCGNEGGATRKSEWGVIPYKVNLSALEDYTYTLDDFPYYLSQTIGNRDQLYQAKYLQYHPAEVNLTISNTWFHREESKQSVRSANNLFNLYEKIVGGNGIYNLNIPPNREGKFPEKIVMALKETGEKIRNTYSTNLLASAEGIPNMIDNNDDTYYEMKDYKNGIIITLPKPITINRFVIQEAIKTHSERIEKHSLLIWRENGWRRISGAGNVGHKRIHRFPKMTSDRFKLVVLESRLTPFIDELSAHLYQE